MSGVVAGCRLKVEGRPPAAGNVQRSTFNAQRSSVRDQRSFPFRRGKPAGDGVFPIQNPKSKIQNPSYPLQSQITNRKSQIGLTLIEVLLALVILGTGLVALVTAAGRCISVARQAKNYETARELLAVVEVEKPMLLEEEPEDIAGNGSFDSHPGFRWVREIEQEGYEEDGLWRVKTQILWTEDKTARREEVVQLLYWPENLGGGTVERR